MSALLPGEQDTRVYEYIDEAYLLEHGHRAGHPVTSLGSGDSMLFLDVLPPELVDESFDTMNDEIDWNIMNHKGSQVPRLISIQGQARDSDGAHPLYRHPADQQPELVPFTPLADRARVIIEELLQQPFNHALIQKYRNGRDNIGEHSDKTLDILRGSAIVNLSLGASRVMILKSKADYVSRLEEPGQEIPTKRLYQKITLPHNSVFVLGWNSNMEFLHSIRADKRLPAEKPAAALAYNEQRISLTFRTIATFIDASGRVTGQGSRQHGNEESEKLSSEICDSQTESNDNVKLTSLSDEDTLKQSEDLLFAFGKENKTSKFDWDANYGQGFDIVNFCFVNDAEKE
mmetsp:Transcript_6176/g.10101  ORF Transcript_6176/g.10101 Transcript_6176/m.10101 type:complete len:345 (+) Transcript_6176:46-1080(+)|eukprot:CAMPEP_0114412152 /NCGR_PEP_ID=MMETSP0103-20121206/171_1 /TAXON_ID=37642 ORGANISM="Paraphysomonas imperforata, Strain PA2" /NCGR_SAMPLE_ID=MMETSP0103 /ASSEMBLY_ACC=CAM_ASM_000201 /LENGTH=344 /DNA_ID=CAMNT_0001580145 /DNA_START=40 /DNA_END=1074 /DNA_ORIENTATION=+